VAAEPTDIVPFGKYKGRPVVDLIADRSYTDWLAAQPWFRQRYGNVYNLIINTGSVPQDSPEHNAMQARFLDHDQAIRICRGWLRDRDELVDAWRSGIYGRALESYQVDNLAIDADHTTAVSSVRFEESGWDLVVEAGTRLKATEVDPDATCTCVCTIEKCASPYSRHRISELAQVHEWSDHLHTNSRRREIHCGGAGCPAVWKQNHGYQEMLNGWVKSSATLGVELKPTLGDDYPSVLREVLKRWEMNAARDQFVGAALVLADEFTFASVDLDKVRRIFRSQRVELMATADLPVLGPPWHCSCRDCRD